MMSLGLAFIGVIGTLLYSALLLFPITMLALDHSTLGPLCSYTTGILRSMSQGWGLRTPFRFGLGDAGPRLWFLLLQLPSARRPPREATFTSD